MADQEPSASRRIPAQGDRASARAELRALTPGRPARARSPRRGSRAVRFWLLALLVSLAVWALLVVGVVRLFG